MVALGRELAWEPWLADYNRVRPINKIRLIELRTDPKYGKFFEHRPASARVRFEADDGAVRVSIDDFISPSIVERLSVHEGVLTPQITDWRAMVDSVFIDASSTATLSPSRWRTSRSGARISCQGPTR